MDNNVLVSVITMTYRRFDRLFDTINSVLSQSYKHIQYIISDDASDDFPEEKIKDLFDKYEFTNFKIIHHNTNVGTVKNLNNACKQCDGDYILLLSCGDVFFEVDTVEKVVKRFQESKCDAMAVRRLAYENNYSPIFFLPHMHSINKIEKKRNREDQYYSYMTNHYWDAFSGSALYFTRKTLEESGFFDEEYKLWEDGPFIEKYLRKHSINYAFDIIAIWYEMGGVSTSQNKNPMLVKDEELFDRTVREKKRDGMSWLYNETNSYIRERSYCTNWRERTVLKLKYPLVALIDRSYLSLKKKYCRMDKRWLADHNINKPDYFSF